MGVCSSLGQCLLVLLNIVFVIVSIIFIVIGVILRFFPGVILQFLYSGINSVTKDFFKIPDGTGELKAVPLFNDLGSVLLIFGFILFIMAFFGCCGACYRWRPLLVVFCICIIILILAISTVGGLFLSPSSPVHSKVKDQLHKEVYSKYKGPQNSDVFSLLINTMSYSLKCCGMQGPSDFNSNASWANYTIPGTTNMFVHIDVTPACCRHAALAAKNLQCAHKSGNSFNTNLTNTEGCYDKILDLVEENKKYSIITILLLITLLALELFAAILLIRNIGQENPM